MSEEREIAEELASQHWAYLESVLVVHGESKETLVIVGHHYRTAFVHGFKHGIEAMVVE